MSAWVKMRLSVRMWGGFELRKGNIDGGRLCSR